MKNKETASLIIVKESDLKKEQYPDEYIDDYIKLLRIPTYGGMQRVLFYDVMQQMCFVVIKV